MIGQLQQLNAQEVTFPKITDGTVIVCILDLSGKSVLIASCCLPPKNSRHNKNVESLTEIFHYTEMHARKVDSLIINGDFNFPSINW